MRIVAIIPAKGHSGRVPEKNFRPFYQGKSLLEIKVLQCQQSGVFDAIYISSDDERAMEVAGRLGAIFVPRNPRFCQDSTPWHEVLQGVLESVPEEDDVWIAWCPVTSPLFRRYGEVVRMLKEKQQEGANSITTVTPLKHYYLNDNFIPLNHRWGAWHAYSQHIPPVYQLNLACTLAQKKEMLFCHYQIGSSPAFFQTEVWEGLDIDTMDEFELAQWYFERHFGDKNA